jgi:septum site-determining protein MinD
LSESILVTSGKGGSGKSTFSVNCGAALAGRGRKVLLVDADAGLRTLDLMLSVADKVVYDLADVLAGRCEPIKAITATDIPGLEILPAPLSADDVQFEPEGMKQLCRGLSRYYDCLIIDSAAGIGDAMRTAAAAADRAIVVSTCDPVSVRDADKTADVLIESGVKDIRLVINMVRPRLIRQKKAYTLDGAIDGAAVRLIGVVPEDEKIAEAAYMGKPVVTLGRSPAARAFLNIAARMDGEDVPLMDL